jgi:exodeoxyribonuclease V alpha subunit
LKTLSDTLKPARTVHAWLGARMHTRQVKHHGANPLPLDVLVVDEASMLNLEMMAQLLSALTPETRLILLGDKDQLASVEAGAILGQLCQRAAQSSYNLATQHEIQSSTGLTIPNEFLLTNTPPQNQHQTDIFDTLLAQHTVMLQRSWRFTQEIGQLADAVRQGDAPRANALLNGNPGSTVQWLTTGPDIVHAVIELALHGRAGAQHSYHHYLQAIEQGPDYLDDPTGHIKEHTAWVHKVLSLFDEFRILCAVHGGPLGVTRVNQTLTNAVHKRLDTPHHMTPNGAWFEARPVIVTHNRVDLGLFNGDIGMTLRTVRASTKTPELKVYFLQNTALRAISPGDLTDVKTAFAMTIHKAQGSEFNHTALLLPNKTQDSEHSAALSRELIYTGITRAKNALTLVALNRDAFTHAIEKPTVRY